MCLPVDGGAVDEAGEHEQPAAEEVGDGAQAKHDVQVVTHSLHEESPQSVLRFHDAGILRRGADSVEYFRQVVFVEQVGHLHEGILECFGVYKISCYEMHNIINSMYVH